MATCNDCLYHETCYGRIAYCMDIDEATGKEILDIEKRCKDFKNKADYAEVKHGEWKLHPDGSGTCSCCNRTQKFVWDYDNAQNFCGHCGAKMSEIPTGSECPGKQDQA